MAGPAQSSDPGPIGMTGLSPDGDSPVDPKPRPNHKRYIEILRGMTVEQKLQIVFDLSETVNSLFRAGLRKRYPDATAEELHRIYLKRLEKCYNRNY
jgi:hypothetical protein